MKPTHNRTARPRIRASLLFCLAFLALVLLLSSCTLIPFSELGGASGTTSAVTTTARSPLSLPEDPIAVDRYLTPEIPLDAGTYAYVAKVASPAVVSIVTEATVYNQYYGSYVESGAGSGVVFYVDAEAGCTYIITNNHVVEGYGTITVYKNGVDTPYSAELLGTDWQTDIAVLRVPSADFVAATVGNSHQLMLGQEVAAIGNPLGKLGGTVTDGIIGCLERTISIEGVSMTLIQHSAGVSPGNSGGGLFNLYGQLIGIVNAKSAGDGVEAIGYAIPVDLAVDRATQIINYGYVSGMPHLGISYRASSSDLVVSGYAYNSELEATNQDTLQAGDILYSLDGVTIGGIADVRKVLSSHTVGDTVEAVLYRPNRYNYTKVTVQLKIHEYIPEGLLSGGEESDSGNIEFN